MKKKKNINFRISDILALIVCSAGITASTVLFVKDITSSLVKTSDTSIGFITFKYRTAQRRFLERVLWDRLKNQSPVYNGDTIRTASLSEATIHFSDGSVLDLHENTLAQVYNSDEESSVIFKQGTITLDTTKSSTGLSVSAGNQKVSVESGSRVQAAAQILEPKQNYPAAQKNDKENPTSLSTEKRENNTADPIEMLSEQMKHSDQTAAEPAFFKLQVIEGSASVTKPLKTSSTSPDSEKTVISKGEAVQLSTTTETHQIPAVFTSSPISALRILNFTGKDTPVLFKWKTEYLPDDCYIRLETSTDKNFNLLLDAIDFSNKDTIELDFKSGYYYWRIRPFSPSLPDMQYRSDSGEINILECPKPSLKAPSPLYTFTYRTKKPEVKLAWQGSQWAASYTITIADNFEMLQPTEIISTTQTELSLQNYGQGTWYWQIQPSYTHIDPQAVAPSSEVFSFTILQSGQLRSPSVIGPKTDSSYQLPLPDTGIHFSWERNIEAVLYLLQFSLDESFSSVTDEKTTSDNYYTLSNTDPLCQPNNLFWRISIKDAEGNFSDFSPTQKTTLLPKIEYIQTEISHTEKQDNLPKLNTPEQAQPSSVTPVANTDLNSEIASNGILIENSIIEPENLFVYIEPSMTIAAEQAESLPILEIITGSVKVSSVSPGILFFDFYELSSEATAWNSTLNGMEPGSHIMKMIYADGAEESHDVLISSSSTTATVKFSYEIPKTEKVFKIGDTGPGGGIVFYDKGSFDDGWRYIECTAVPVAAASWVKTTESPHSAAAAANNYSSNGLKNWYLPSKEEMSLMFQVMKKNDASIFPDGYWSSTQADDDTAWYQNTVYGYVDIADKKEIIAVRPVRRF